jgi:hypothetical protein
MRTAMMSPRAWFAKAIREPVDENEITRLDGRRHARAAPRTGMSTYPKMM